MTLSPGGGRGLKRAPCRPSSLLRVQRSINPGGGAEVRRGVFGWLLKHDTGHWHGSMLWHMVWYVVCGIWYMIHGIWNDGMWYVVCGTWYMVNGMLRHGMQLWTDMTRYELKLYDITCNDTWYMITCESCFTHDIWCMYVCMCVYVCVYVCMSVCLYVCMSVCLHVCMSVCLSACLSVCMYVCIYIYIYTHIA